MASRWLPVSVVGLCTSLSVHHAFLTAAQLVWPDTDRGGHSTGPDRATVLPLSWSGQTLAVVTRVDILTGQGQDEATRLGWPDISDIDCGQCTGQTTDL